MYIAEQLALFALTFYDFVMTIIEMNNFTDYLQA